MHRSHSLVAALLILASPAFAEWPVTGIMLGESLYQRHGGYMYIVPDGARGAIALSNPWHRTTRVDPEGGVLWSVNPYAALSLPDPSLSTPNVRVIEADGFGGCWLASWDTNHNVVALHFDGSGVAQGRAVTLCENLPGLRYAQAAVRDAMGGLFVLWQDERAPGDVDIMVSHVDASGSVTGPVNGLVVFGGAGSQILSGAVSDGQGGLLVVEHLEFGATAQRFDADLQPKYGTGARVVAPAALGPFSIAATGDGGAFVAWLEGPGTPARVRVQRLDASGLVAPGWPAEGVTVASTPGLPRTVHVVADGRGGACVAWVDQHKGEDGWEVQDVRVSRVLANGRVAGGWQPAGVVAGGADWPSLESRSILVADGVGGCYVAWADRGGTSRAMNAQHIAADGRVYPGWPAAGLRVGGQMGECQSPSAIPDGAGGVYVGWDEYTYPSYVHLARLIRLSPGGLSGEPVPPPVPSLALARIAPNPARGLFTVNTTLPDDRPARLEVFDLAGRASHVRELRGTGEQGLTLDSSALAPGVHWLRLTHPTGVRRARIVVVP